MPGKHNTAGRKMYKLGCGSFNEFRFSKSVIGAVHTPKEFRMHKNAMCTCGHEYKYHNSNNRCKMDKCRCHGFYHLHICPSNGVPCKAELNLGNGKQLCKYCGYVMAYVHRDQTANYKQEKRKYKDNTPEAKQFYKKIMLGKGVKSPYEHLNLCTICNKWVHKSKDTCCNTPTRKHSTRSKAGLKDRAKKLLQNKVVGVGGKHE